MKNAFKLLILITALSSLGLMGCGDEDRQSTLSTADGGVDGSGTGNGGGDAGTGTGDGGGDLGIKVHIPLEMSFAVDSSLKFYNGAQEFTITITDIHRPDPVVCVTNPCNEFYVVFELTSPGGCGPNADPRCLGPPSFSQEITLYEIDGVVDPLESMGMVFTLVELSQESAKIAIDPL